MPIRVSPRSPALRRPIKYYHLNHARTTGKPSLFYYKHISKRSRYYPSNHATYTVNTRTHVNLVVSIQVLACRAPPFIFRCQSFAPVASSPRVARTIQSPVELCVITNQRVGRRVLLPRRRGPRQILHQPIARYSRQDERVRTATRREPMSVPGPTSSTQTANPTIAASTSPT